MRDKLVTVFGASGFVGRYVVAALLREGARVRVAERTPRRGWFLKAQAGLGQIEFVAADITRPKGLGRALEGADVAINLVGILKGDFTRVHVEGARLFAQAAKLAGVSRLIQVSAIGADRASASAYGRSKGEGEDAVRAAFPGAIIVRPSIIFGREDQFINRFAALIRMLPVVPVIGATTRFQPVFVGDVAQAIAMLAAGKGEAGLSYELGGPQILSMHELNAWIAARTGRDRPLLDVPPAIAAAMARLTGWLPGAPITYDQWLMLQNDNVVSPKAATLTTLGIAPTALDSVAEGWLVEYRKHGRFGAAA